MEAQFSNLSYIKFSRKISLANQMIKTLVQFKKKKKLIAKQRRKRIIFDVKELKMANPRGISLKGYIWFATLVPARYP